MSAASAPGGRAGPAALRLALDLAFTLAAPLTLLRPDLPGLPGGVGGWLGPVPAYLLASLVPAAYLLWSALRARQVQAVTLLAALSALLQGALSFWPLSGLAFAVKDSSGSLFLLLTSSVSLLIHRPLFGEVLRAALLPSTPAERARLGALLRHPAARRACVRATRALQVKAVLVASLNILIKSQLVTAPFGSADFNAQLAHATTLMVPLAYLASAVTYSGAAWLARRGLQRAAGRPLPLVMWGRPFWDALNGPA